MIAGLAVQVLEARWPLMVTALLVIFAPVLFRYVNKLLIMAKIPIMGEELGDASKRRSEYVKNGRKMYQNTYFKFKDKLCRLATNRQPEMIVVSPSLLTELDKHPDSVVSFREAISDNLMIKWTKLEEDGRLVAQTVKQSLTPALFRLNPVIEAEVNEAMALEMPSCKTWTPVVINAKLLRIVAMVSGRVFIGPELCHDETYLDAAINYTVDLMKAVRAIQAIPSWQRNWRASRLPEVKRLHNWIDKAMAFLRPVVQERIDKQKDWVASGRDADEFQKEDDMLQWLMDTYEKRHGQVDVEHLAKTQLSLSFAAIHTTTLTVTNAFYNLAAMPEVQKILREEAEEVLAESGGAYTTSALQKMKKLDSFLRETMRLEPPGFATYSRKILKPIMLSTGHSLPSGSQIEVAQAGLNVDPNIFPDPHTFDPLRFYKLRESVTHGASQGKKAAEAGAMNQFVSVNTSHLIFGYGKHACPGRFFAANEVKMIFGNFTRKYEVRNAEGVQGRVPNLAVGVMSIPDPTRELLFKEI